MQELRGGREGQREGDKWRDMCRERWGEKKRWRGRKGESEGGMEVVS